MVAEKLGLEATNKEGWVNGLATVLLASQQKEIRLSVAFPVERSLDGFHEKLSFADGATLECYGFYEDTVHPERYDVELEDRLSKIVEVAKPDLVHCFGTEYPHTLALCRVFPQKERILIGIQGLCAACAEAYMADLPQSVVRSVTFRDLLRRDTLRVQQQKFVKRGEMEREAVGLAGNVTGRTPWDRQYTTLWNPKAAYYEMNETLRPTFYEGEWREEECIPHSIFLSQGDYPLKGLHYMLMALPQILERYPDATVNVAGNSLVQYETLKDKLKISAYGKYLRKLIKKYDLQDRVHFLGRLSAEEMKRQYLKSNLFVCCSSLENSPNSLGEAMLLGVPCVTAMVGGISGIFRAGEDGIGYEGYSTENSGQLKAIADRLSFASLEMFEKSEFREKCKNNAREHAKMTHEGNKNYSRLLEIYSEISRK